MNLQVEQLSMSWWLIWQGKNYGPIKENNFPSPSFHCYPSMRVKNIVLTNFAEQTIDEYIYIPSSSTIAFLITGLNLPKKKITQFINSRTSEKAHSNKCNNMETKCHVMNKNLENRYWGKAKAPLDHNVYHVSSPRPSMKWVQFHQQSILLQEHINYQPDQNIITNKKIELMAPILPNIFNHNQSLKPIEKKHLIWWLEDNVKSIGTNWWY